MTTTDNLKSFLLRSSECQTMPVRSLVKSPRACIFIHAREENNFLRDPTENKRWWPVAN